MFEVRESNARSEEALGSFDSQATKVTKFLTQLPTIRYVKHIVEYFETIGQFLTKMVGAIAKRDF